MPLSEISDHLSKICGNQHVFTSAEELFFYGMDQTLDLHFPFDVLVKPGTADEIASVLKVCNTYKIPVTPRGGGSGVTGGALPVRGGVVLSLERLNKIIKVDKTDAYVIAEAGVVTADLCREVEKSGLCFPVEPSSSHFSFIGGNVAENAGSIRSCKYGTTTQYVLNLEVVLADGTIIWTGANVRKNVTGLNLTQLFVGSEGVLGIITKVVYRLLPAQGLTVSLLAAFEDVQSACNAVIDIRRSAIFPSAVELIGHNALKITAEYLKEPLPLMSQEVKAHLLLEFQHHNKEMLNDEIDRTVAVIEKYIPPEDILFADNDTGRKQLWKLRFSIGNAIKNDASDYRDIDISVPLSFLYQYIGGVEEICARNNIAVAWFGHAMDGNLHTMLLTKKRDRLNGYNINETAIREIYTYAISNGGVISGEHGIGFLQKEFMDIQFSVSHLALIKKIKALFDPNGILNPGKLF